MVLESRITLLMRKSRTIGIPVNRSGEKVNARSMKGHICVTKELQIAPKANIYPIVEDA